MQKRVSMKIKICGIKYQDNLEAIAAFQPDYLGFIFYPKSKRFMAEELQSEKVIAATTEIQRVGVFVNEPIPSLLKAAKTFDLSVLQIHGDESPAYLQELQLLLEHYPKPLKVVKAFGVAEDFDFNELEAYKPFVDYFLFDTKTKAYGGSGKQFNWSILEQYDNEKPLWLSGGIGVEELEEVAQLKDLNLHLIDMNSRLELKPGLKDINKTKQAIEKIRELSVQPKKK